MQIMWGPIGFHRGYMGLLARVSVAAVGIKQGSEVPKEYTLDRFSDLGQTAP